MMMIDGHLVEADEEAREFKLILIFPYRAR